MDKGKVVKMLSFQWEEHATFRFTNQYGQYPDTEEKYRDAIIASCSILHLPLSISEIARMCRLHPECLRNQLKRHFPDILETRREIRMRLGFKEYGNYGVKKKTVEKYAYAIQLLHDPSVTIRKAASVSGVSFHGLQQYLLFFHKDLSDSRMLIREDALADPDAEKKYSAKGGCRVPRPDVLARYAPAVELYRTTDLPLTEIAKRCNVPAHNLDTYLRRWHMPLKKQRQQQAKRLLEEKRKAPKEVRSKIVLAKMKYTPAIELITSGNTLSEAAREIGVPVSDLSIWMKSHHSDVMEKAQAGMMRLPSGRFALRKTYFKYLPIAQYIDEHPAEASKDVANKWNVPVSSLCKKMLAYFPEIWEKHCRLCSVLRDSSQT